MEIILLSLIVAAGSLILLTKMLGFKRLVKWQVFVDILATIGLPIVFFGTFSGMVVAFFSGLIISLFLWMSKKLINLYQPAS